MIRLAQRGKRKIISIATAQLAVGTTSEVGHVGSCQHSFFSSDDFYGSVTSKESEKSLEALRLEHEKFEQLYQEQIEALHRFSTHNRKMLRLTFILLGILVTGVGYLGSTNVGQLLNSDICSLTFLGWGNCTPLNWVAVITLLCYLCSITMFIQISDINPMVSIQSQNLSGDRFQSERAYLRIDIEEKIENIETIVDFRRERKKLQNIASFSLLFGIVAAAVIWYNVTTGKSRRYSRCPGAHYSCDCLFLPSRISSCRTLLNWIRVYLIGLLDRVLSEYVVVRQFYTS